jgi:Iron-containing redox enzyme
MGTAQTLGAKMGLLLPQLTRTERELLTHSRVRELYPEFLFTTHCIIRASVPLMEAALGRAESMASDDPVAAGLVEYFREHIVEEMDHDDWLLDDLEVLGRDRSTVLARPPSPTVASLVGAQYYWVLHYHPVALLGYIALLEGYPPSAELIDELIASTGYRREAFRTIIAHAELDPHHREELHEILDSLPLTPQQSTVLGLSAMYSVHLVARAIDEIVA